MRILATFALLAATAAYVLLHPPVDLAASHGALAACPERFGLWNGSDLTFADAVLDELKADDILVRRYERGPDVAWLTIVYHQNRRYGAHDPTVCYESQGYTVEPVGPRRLADGSRGGLPVFVFRATRQSEQRLVYYWWSTQGLTTTDVTAMRSRMALAGALDNRSWGAFVRLETRLGPGGEPAAVRGLDDFGERVARALPAVFAAAGRRKAG